MLTSNPFDTVKEVLPITDILHFYGVEVKQKIKPFAPCTMKNRPASPFTQAPIHGIALVAGRAALQSTFLSAVAAIPLENSIKIQSRRIMGVEITQLSHDTNSSLHYSLDNTTILFDEALKERERDGFARIKTIKGEYK